MKVKSKYTIEKIIVEEIDKDGNVVGMKIVKANPDKIDKTKGTVIFEENDWEEVPKEKWEDVKNGKYSDNRSG